MKRLRRIRGPWLTLLILATTSDNVDSGFAPNDALGSRSHSHSHQPTITSRLCEQRERRTRRTSIHRKPRNYWSSIVNVEHAFRTFWLELNVTVSQTRPPTIPNQALLVHLNRHDLRSVIEKYGGRELLAEDLGGAEIMPGRWKAAVNESSELKQLFKSCPHLGLSRESPPLSPQQKKARGQTSESHDKKWAHRKSRNPRDFWNRTIFVQQLYEYLDECQVVRNRPAVWMPQPAEIGESGRHGLRQCIFRYGGPAKICKLCGLVPLREWFYFEGQLDLLKNLKEYLDEFHEGDFSSFPMSTEIQKHSYDTLYYLIQRYGGRRALASRFSMKCPTKGGNPGRGDYEGVYFGAFSVPFAIDLLEFIRAEQMKKKAPLKITLIRMPSKYNLDAAGRNDLHQQIEQFGGYENVARRLGLAFFL